MADTKSSSRQVITARFASKCAIPWCRHQVEAGDRVFFERGRGVWHLSHDHDVPLSATERREYAVAMQAGEAIDTETYLAQTGWDREATIARRARWNAAQVSPDELDEWGYCERLGLSKQDLQDAIKYHGL